MGNLDKWGKQGAGERRARGAEGIEVGEKIVGCLAEWRSGGVMVVERCKVWRVVGLGRGSQSAKWIEVGGVWRGESIGEA